MTLRRAPRWTVGLTSSSLAVVLVAAVGALGVVEPPQPAPVTQVIRAAPVEPVQRPMPAPPAPAPEPVPAAVPAVAPPGPFDSRVPLAEGVESLGPPPGPQFDPRPERTAAPQDRYAFLAGVTDYRPPTTDTIGSANDVRFLASMLVEQGWQPENIRVIVDGQVTGAALREGMAWLADRSVPGTFTLFHWSGHVKQFGGGTEALWPVDRDWVRDRDVTAALSRGTGKLWVDIAGCEAGSFAPGLPSDRVLFSGSSKGTEKSYEFPEWGMSVWAGLLFDLGTTQGGADADGDGRVTMGEALRYSTYYAQAITLTQKPYGRQTPQVEGDPVRGWTLADPPA